MMSRQTFPVMWLYLSSAGVVMLVAVFADAQRAGAQPAAAPSRLTKGEVLAEVDGVAITKEEIEKSLAAQLSKLEEQIYTLKQRRLDAVIAERLLAKEAAKRGVSPTALLDAEVTSKVGLVTEQEIEAFYQANKAALKEDNPTQREQVRSRLQSQKVAVQRDAFLQRLRSEAKVAVYLTPPPVHRAEVNADGALFVGAADAPVTIVEFSDFHCPFCKRAEDTVAQVLTKYGDRVKLVWRDYPIDKLHPQARKAHEAARCAAEQGKFWPYQKALFAGPARQPDQLPAVAQETGLDVASFKECVASGKHQATVQKDVEEGRRLEVNGTPTFFINGRVLSGAQPLEAFVRVIDDELARSKPTTAKP
jgi:protein-disulfide isomerase